MLSHGVFVVVVVLVIVVVVVVVDGILRHLNKIKKKVYANDVDVNVRWKIVYQKKKSCTGSDGYRQRMFKIMQFELRND